MDKEKANHQYECFTCEGKGEVLNIGNYLTTCDVCKGTGVNRIKQLEAERERLINCIIADIKFHNKYEVAYAHLGKQNIKCVLNSIKTLEEIIGKPIKKILNEKKK